MIILSEFRPTILQRIFSRDASKRFLRFSPYFLTIKSVNGAVQIPYDQILGIGVEKRLVLSKIKFNLATGADESFGWVNLYGPSDSMRARAPIFARAN